MGFLKSSEKISIETVLELVFLNWVFTGYGVLKKFAAASTIAY